MTVSAPSAFAQDRLTPEIVAQGFDIAGPRIGRLGQFDRLRIRIEAPKRIQELSIRERSFEVDLATTLDGDNYRLFDIKKRVRQYQDVTIDLRTYINEKISEPGRYQFSIRVRDSEDRVVTADLTVIAEKLPDRSETEPRSEPVERGLFRFERGGAGSVRGADAFGIGWTTIDGTNMVIRIVAPDPGYALAADLSESDYDGIATPSDLRAVLGSLDDSRMAAHVDLNAAQNSAAGKVLAVVTPDTFNLLRFTSSATSLSSTGTRVVLQGDYMHVVR